MITNGMFPRLVTVFSLCIGCLLSVSIARSAEPPEDRFVRAYSLVTEADALKASGDSQEALKVYRKAQAELFELKRDNPTWNTRIVNTRLSNLAERIAALSQPGIEASPVSAASASASGSGTAASDPVKLLTAGAEPRRELRLQPAAGSTQKLRMVMKTITQVEMAGMPAQTISTPAMHTDMQATTKSVAPNGDIAYEFQLTEVSVEEDAAAQPEIVAAMKASLAGLKDLSGNGTVTSRGITRVFELKPPATSDPQLRQSVDQMKETFGTIIIALPEAAVGPGARWEIRTPIKSQGMTIQQTATYELVSIDGDQIVTRTTIVQSATNQKVQNPAMPAVKVDLTRMSGEGSGTATVNLGKLLPSSGAVKSKSDTTMAMNIGGRAQSMRMNLDVDIKMEEKK